MIPLGGGGASRGRRSPNVHSVPLNIWKTARARTLKLKTPLDMVKYSLWVHYFQLGGPGGAGPLRQLLVSDIKCFPYDNYNITVYSHTNQKRKEKDISAAHKVRYEH